jgi:hypothetical protein
MAYTLTSVTSWMMSTGSREATSPVLVPYRSDRS